MEAVMHRAIVDVAAAEERDAAVERTAVVVDEEVAAAAMVVRGVGALMVPRQRRA